MDPAELNGCDDPALIAKGRRYLAWLAGGTAVFVVVATFAVHVAKERHERALMNDARTTYATAIGTDVARYFPGMY